MRENSLEEAWREALIGTLWDNNERLMHGVGDALGRFTA
jgi:hypothetical protein